MKTLIAILLSPLAIGVQAQTSGILNINGSGGPDARQKPPTCGKYQHVFHWPGTCGPSSCDENGGCFAVCYPPPPDRCVDDIHTVTEAEWQALMKRVAELEHPASDMRLRDFWVIPQIPETGVYFTQDNVRCSTSLKLKKARVPCDAKHPQFCISGRYIP